jgi:hypothetical protein
VAGECDEIVEPCECALVRRVRTVHERGKLQVNADRVEPEVLHFTEVALDRGPVLVPVLLEEPHARLGRIVIVVDTFGYEPRIRESALERPVVRRDFDHVAVLEGLRLGGPASDEGATDD